MRPIRLTRGGGSPGPDPGWTYLEGGAGNWKLGPLAIVYLSMVDPEGQVWVEWFFASSHLPLGLRVLNPYDRRFENRR